jgi:hypothetical protein
MDETALRIIIEDGGRSAGPAPAGPRTVAPGPTASSQPAAPVGSRAAVAAAWPGPAASAAPAEPAAPAPSRRRSAAAAAGLFPEGYSSRGEVKTPLFPAGYASQGGLFGAENNAAAPAQGSSVAAEILKVIDAITGQRISSLLKGLTQLAGQSAQQRVTAAAGTPASAPAAPTAAAGAARAAQAASAAGGQAGPATTTALTAAGAATADAAAAGAGTAASAAGIAGVAVLVAKVVSDGLERSAQAVGRRAGLAADVAGNLAANRHAATYAASQNLAADVVESMPLPLSKTLAEVGRSAGKVVEAFDKTVDAFVKRGEELARFSPEISSARAQADVRSLQSDVREAEALGPSLASLTDSQSRIDNDLREILLPIKKFVVEVLAGFLEKLADGVNVVKNLPAIIKETVQTLAEALGDIITFHGAEALKVIDGLPDRLARILKKDEVPPDLMERFFTLADEAAGFAYKKRSDPLNLPERSKAQKLNVPAFAGL